MSGAAIAAATSNPLASGAAIEKPAAQPVECWDVFELHLHGPAEGNPFIDVQLSAQFSQGHRTVSVDGFYDGEGKYLVRFMPDAVGRWDYQTTSNAPQLANSTGFFICVKASGGNRGPVSVRDTYHFGYADGTPFYPFGTTCYAWVFQKDELQEQTLKTLAVSPFNKLRMCIFPKWYRYNHAEPPIYPFPRNGDVNDYSHFQPEYFRHIEERIENLRSIGVEADLILFHPYDKWGYQSMSPEVDERYLRYVIARFAAYRNVWWSLANEYNFLKSKTAGDWDRFARIVEEADPYSHLRSIHYSGQSYDYSRRWCTHAGVQDTAFDKAADWRKDWGKPVIFDECQYEGNISNRWGSISGNEMCRRFWLSVIHGTYGGHAETYLTPDEILWWSHGGVLRGESPARIAFLRRILEETGSLGSGTIGFTAIPGGQYLAAERANHAAMFYFFDCWQPSEQSFTLPEGFSYMAEWIDIWEMKITLVGDTLKGAVTLKLPGSPGGALRFVVQS